MSQIAIKVEGVSKQYRIFHRPQYDSVKEAIVGSVNSLLRRESTSVERFWALRDVSFDVRQGEVLGVLGGNGAGKSTLLKILARITELSEGCVSVYDRMASLLEVGSGFHPELSGRENVYLNGTILGMRRSEIRRKFDEIVAFSEIEQFIDSPVKHYSSGMYMRLAFSVAAHLEAAIMLVDEVLAVGDAAFQDKCLRKMSALSASEGRAIIYISHDMTTVKRLCNRALYLQGGRVQAMGDAFEVISAFQNAGR